MTQPVLHFLEWVHQQGWMGGFLLVFCYAFCCVTFLPGSLLTLGAGAVYGVGLGTALISAGSLLGSTLSFLASRYLFRAWIARKLAAHELFQRLDEAVGKEGWRVVFLSRLSPIFPFSVLNYGLGLTRISIWEFMAASWLGTLPLIVAYTYGGKVAGSVAALAQKGAAKPIGSSILQGLGLIATVLLCVVLTRMATRVLRGKLR